MPMRPPSLTRHTEAGRGPRPARPREDSASCVKDSRYDLNARMTVLRRSTSPARCRRQVMLIISLAIFQERHKAGDRADAQECCTKRPERLLFTWNPRLDCVACSGRRTKYRPETIFYEAGVIDRDSACRCACRSRPRKGPMSAEDRRTGRPKMTRAARRATADVLPRSPRTAHR
jgi:hypothetical protein